MCVWKVVFDDVFECWGIILLYSDVDYFDYVDGKKCYDGVVSFLYSCNVEVFWGEVDDDLLVEMICGIGNCKNVVFVVFLCGQGIVLYFGFFVFVESLYEVGIFFGVVFSFKNVEEVLVVVGICLFFCVVVDGVVVECEGFVLKFVVDMFVVGVVVFGVDLMWFVVVEDVILGVVFVVVVGFVIVVGVDCGVGVDVLYVVGVIVVVEDFFVFVFFVQIDILEIV